MTTKIQFKLSNDVLLTVIKMVEQTDDFIVQSINDALLISIKEDLIAKLEDKAKTIQKQTSILDHNKKHAIVLKYHEAYTMYKLLEVVYNKETFAEHIHIKRIKRLLIDLTQKVENFGADNQTMATDHATVKHEMLAEQDNSEMDLVTLEEVENISVENYSIFDLFDNDTFKDNNLTEIDENIVDQTIDEEIVNEEIIQPAEIDENVVDQTIETEIVDEEIIQSAEIDENIVEQTIETEIVDDEIIQPTKIDENIIDQTIETEIVDEEIIQPTKIDENVVEQTIEAEIANEETAKKVEKPVNDIIVNNASIIFNGVVSKSSISIELEEEQDNLSNNIEAIAETYQSTEEISLFKEIEITTSSEKEEKIKREKKKKPKGDSSEGQISLF